MRNDSCCHTYRSLTTSSKNNRLVLLNKLMQRETFSNVVNTCIKLCMRKEKIETS